MSFTAGLMLLVLVAMISAGFSKKEAMELIKTFLSSSIHDATNNLMGGISKWTL